MSRLDPHELAELYVAGAASDEQRAFLEARLRAGDAVYLEPYGHLKDIAEKLFDSIEPIAPSAAARADIARLVARPAGREAAPAFSAPDQADDPLSRDPALQVILRGADMDWHDSGVPGVTTRSLFVDRVSNRMTVLIRMAPGARYPDHEHPDVEECLVLDGDLHIADTVLRKMDYLRTPAGGVHGEPWTESGCLLLVTCGVAA